MSASDPTPRNDDKEEEKKEKAEQETLGGTRAGLFIIPAALEFLGPVLAGFQAAAAFVGYTGIGAFAKWVTDKWCPFTRWFWTQFVEWLDLSIRLTAAQKDALTTAAFFVPMLLWSVFFASRAKIFMNPQRVRSIAQISALALVVVLLSPAFTNQDAIRHRDIAIKKLEKDNALDKDVILLVGQMVFPETSPSILRGFRLTKSSKWVLPTKSDLEDIKTIDMDINEIKKLKTIGNKMIGLRWLTPVNPFEKLEVEEAVIVIKSIVVTDGLLKETTSKKLQDWTPQVEKSIRSAWTYLRIARSNYLEDEGSVRIFRTLLPYFAIAFFVLFSVSAFFPRLYSKPLFGTPLLTISYLAIAFLCVSMIGGIGHYLSFKSNGSLELASLSFVALATLIVSSRTPDRLLATVGSALLFVGASICWQMVVWIINYIDKTPGA